MDERISGEQLMSALQGMEDSFENFGFELDFLSDPLFDGQFDWSISYQLLYFEKAAYVFWSIRMVFVFMSTSNIPIFSFRDTL